MTSREGGKEQTGLVVASYGSRGILHDADGNRHRYILKGRKLRAVCGDSVDWLAARAGGEAVVCGVHERRNALARPDGRGGEELLAANLTRIAVVLAPEPAPDFQLADRYLCAAEIMGARALIVWNKSDLSDTTPAELAIYRSLDYPIISVSAASGAGIRELESALAEGVSMFVGQSGVGKSSLLNRLVDAADAATGSLGETSREGRHTTTASIMYFLENGGQLIDSPGVREFVPLIRDAARVQVGYREIVALANRCRFSDCLHLREPGCAVKAACEAGTIAETRYNSYKRLYHSTREQRA